MPESYGCGYNVSTHAKYAYDSNLLIVRKLQFVNCIHRRVATDFLSYKKKCPQTKVNGHLYMLKIIVLFSKKVKLNTKVDSGIVKFFLKGSF